LHSAVETVVRCDGLKQPFDAHYCQIGTAVPNRVKPSFVIFWHPDTYAQPWASECPDVKNYKRRLNPVWHRMYRFGNSGRQRVNDCASLRLYQLSGDFQVATGCPSVRPLVPPAGSNSRDGDVRRRERRFVVSRVARRTTRS